MSNLHKVKRKMKLKLIQRDADTVGILLKHGRWMTASEIAQADRRVKFSRPSWEFALHALRYGAALTRTTSLGFVEPMIRRVCEVTGQQALAYRATKKASEVVSGYPRAVS